MVQTGPQVLCPTYTKVDILCFKTYVHKYFVPSESTQYVCSGLNNTLLLAILTVTGTGTVIQVK